MQKGLPERCGSPFAVKQYSARRARVSLALARSAAGSGGGCSRGRRLPPQLDLGFEACGLAVMRVECRCEAVVGCGVKLAAALLGAINRVAERLRCLVRQLACAECLEPRFPVVESILRRLSRAVQLLFQSIDECHCRLASKDPASNL